MTLCFLGKLLHVSSLQAEERCRVFSQSLTIEHLEVIERDGAKEDVGIEAAAGTVELSAAKRSRVTVMDEVRLTGTAPRSTIRFQLPTPLDLAGRFHLEGEWTAELEENRGAWLLTLDNQLFSQVRIERIPVRCDELRRSSTQLQLPRAASPSPKQTEPALELANSELELRRTVGERKAERVTGDALKYQIFEQTGAWRRVRVLLDGKGSSADGWVHAEALRTLRQVGEPSFGTHSSSFPLVGPGYFRPPPPVIYAGPALIEKGAPITSVVTAHPARSWRVRWRAGEEFVELLEIPGISNANRLPWLVPRSRVRLNLFRKDGIELRRLETAPPRPSAGPIEISAMAPDHELAKLGFSVGDLITAFVERDKLIDAGTMHLDDPPDLFQKRNVGPAFLVRQGRPCMLQLKENPEDFADYFSKERRQTLPALEPCKAR